MEAVLARRMMEVVHACCLSQRASTSQHTSRVAASINWLLISSLLDPLPSIPPPHPPPSPRPFPHSYTENVQDETVHVEIRVRHTQPLQPVVGGGAAVGNDGVGVTAVGAGQGLEGLDPPASAPTTHDAAAIAAAAAGHTAPTPPTTGGTAPLKSDAVYIPTAVADRYSFLSLSK
jgi:hypothetical protein